MWWSITVYSQMSGVNWHIFPWLWRVLEQFFSTGSFMWWEAEAKLTMRIEPGYVTAV